MSRLILPIILVLFALNVQSQNFSFDNVNFSTISWDDFFKRLDSSPNLIFFDIRTPGERADTSQFSSYNQGKIKGNQASILQNQGIIRSNQKAIVDNQKSLKENQRTIIGNQNEIIKNQKSILKNQKTLDVIVKNQQAILKTLKKK